MKARRDVRQIADAAPDLRRQSPQPPVIARLIDQPREQVPQPPTSEREELAIVGHAQQHLGDRQRDQLGIAELRWTTRAAMTRAEEIIETDVESDDEGVESGGQRGLQGRRCVNTANFGALNPFQLFRINHLADILKTWDGT